ncbi:MAG: 1-acyl-sn-glycerol-3-phosphate acyltransferase [Deltaproteobacteria bacterium]|nr:1-acyl-sn-glycerol-3-phosphate acyltransferase [Deltaproteobacteria bacterium]
MASVVSFLRLAVGFVLVAVLGVLAIVIALPLLPWRTGRIKLCNVYGKIIGRAVTFLAGARPHIAHRERLDASMPAIYVANHTSTLDAFLSIWLCPMGGCGVFKKEITRIPFFGWLLLLSGHIRLNRSDRQGAVAALAETAAFVRDRKLGIWIMPEGTRSKDGRLLPFKKGFVHLAIATGFPVVPVVFHGAYRNWEKHTFRFVPMDLDIEVLEPVDTSMWREDTAGAHADQVQRLFAAALRADQKPLPLP